MTLGRCQSASELRQQGTAVWPRRSAFSLIEVAVAISILSVVLALSMTTIVALFRIERQFAADATHELAIARLAAQFRDDVHLATAVEMNGGCKLILPAGRIVEYTITDSVTTRVVSREGATEHRDSFLLGRQALVSFSFAPDFTDRRLLQLKIGPAIESKPTRASSIRPLTIEAAVNLHGQRTTQEVQP
jgi:prepilin-type N-terminal cleavage/methylation domain-containing protein